ncbi:MAG: haloacid dehalogenase-like hydrolase [Muribaculaceae bacterium]|nr:haloacid dehalogenase-like hydrolase [Muribaculaceae bacterium]
MGQGRKIAVFDLDGTLINGSTFNRFVKFLIFVLVKFLGEYRTALKVLNIFIKQYRGLKSRCEAKFEIMEIADKKLERVYFLLFALKMTDLCNKKVTKELMNLNKAGYYTVLLSASPHQYVSYLGYYYDFSFTEGTWMTLSADDYVETRGERKALILKDLIKEDDVVEYIFTDHQDDYKMINLCPGAKVVLVNPTKELKEMCNNDGIDFEIIQ